MEVMASEWKDFIEDNKFMSIGAAMSALLLAVLVVLGMPDQPAVSPRPRPRPPSPSPSVVSTGRSATAVVGSAKKIPRSNGKKHD